MTLRVATYNVHRCIGRDGVESPQRIAAVLREIDADLIALQEVASRPGSPENLLLQLEKAVCARAIYGFTLVEQNGHYGNVVLSRIDISSVNHLDISVPKREPRGIIDIELFAGQCRIEVLATHLGLASGERRKQVRRILSRLETTTADVTILLGDFNEWFFWGRPLRWLKQWFKPMPTLATFPANRPILGLDRIWIHPPEKMISLHVHVTKLSKVASDHLPLVADIDL
ncbi:MAG: endonuclease/exonuclease/phosphatase family protein [Gammaproteobacteria bacterium]